MAKVASVSTLVKLYDILVSLPGRAHVFTFQFGVRCSNVHVHDTKSRDKETSPLLSLVFFFLFFFYVAVVVYCELHNSIHL